VRGKPSRVITPVEDFHAKNRKLKFINGVPHRKRRGRWVEIPAEWYGHIPNVQTMNKRDGRETVSRRTRKSKKEQ
jgi:hypothetical protein